MVAPASSRPAFFQDSPRWQPCREDGGATWGRSLVHVGGIDFLAREAKLQDFDVFGPVKDLAGEEALDDDAQAAKGDADGGGDAQEQAGENENLEHDEDERGIGGRVAGFV